MSESHQEHVLVRRQYIAVGRVLDLHESTIPALIVDSDIRNAQSEDGVIRYNPAWLRSLLGRLGDDRSRREAFIRGLMAHELAHHLDQPGSDEVLVREQFADAVAGMVLGIMQSPTVPYVRLLSLLPPSPHHPTLKVRIARLYLGHDVGGQTGLTGLEGILRAGSGRAFGERDHDMKASASAFRTIARAAAATAS